MIHITPEKSPKLTSYMPYIDGIRAMAILSVVAYHASPFHLRGGFVGVDIFFVISGFLISGIIFRSLIEERFSFIDFYSRRIRRIFPALILVLLATFVGGWFTLLADEFKQLGKHMAASAGFVENFLLWREAGYFDTASELKPLMHLWSLAIEEQYYLAYPLLVVALWRYRDKLFLIIAVFALISFALNVGLIHINPVATFFLPQTRIWELLAGGLLAYRQINTGRVPVSAVLNNLFAIMGLLLIVAAVFIINKQYSFPGWWALLPVTGTLLLIQAGSNAWINRTLLSHSWLVAIGLISYPLYLWHWPLLTIARILEGGMPSREIRIASVIISMLLAWLTYVFIEKPLRISAITRLKTLILVLLMSAVGGVGYYTYLHDGLPARDNERNQFALYFENSAPDYQYIKTHGLEKAYRMECDFWDWMHDKSVRTKLDSSCYTPDSDKSIFLWGDSHVQHLNYGLTKAMPADISILQIATSACKPAYVEDSHNSSDFNGCSKSNSLAVQKIKAIKPDIVIIAQLDQHEKPQIDIIISKLKEFGVGKIILVGPDPHWIEPYLFKIILDRYWLFTPKRITSNLDPEVFAVDKRLKAKYAASSDVQYVSVVDYLCNFEGCLVYFGNDRREGISTWDYGHFTKLTSENIARDLLAPILLKDLQ